MFLILRPNYSTWNEWWMSIKPVIFVTLACLNWWLNLHDMLYTLSAKTRQSQETWYYACQSNPDFVRSTNLLLFFLFQYVCWSMFLCISHKSTHRSIKVLRAIPSHRSTKLVEGKTSAITNQRQAKYKTAASTQWEKHDKITFKTATTCRTTIKLGR